MNGYRDDDIAGWQAMTLDELVDDMGGRFNRARATEMIRVWAAARHAALFAFTRDAAFYGLHCDTTPTMPGGGRDTSWWYSYMGDADRRLRDRAKAALREPAQ